MMVVLVIVAIGSALVVPMVEGGYEAREVRRAARQIASTMHYCRGEAVALGQPQELVIDAIENSIHTTGWGRWAVLTDRAVIEDVRGGQAFGGGVALACPGVGVGPCLQTFAASLRMQQRGSRETRAVLAARAAMDALIATPEIQDHNENRDSAEGFRTHVLVRHAGPDEGLSDKALDFQSDYSLRYLQVDITWQDGAGAKTYTLKSLRMAPENE